MAIVLEGPDAAGKSTLGRTLAGQFGMKLMMSGGAPKNPHEVEEYCEWQMRACDDRTAVIDRVTCISHPIYNPEYRHSSFLQLEREKMINHPEVIIVYCRPPTHELMRPEKHAWKDYDTEEHKQRVLNNQMTFIDLYDEAFLKIPHLPYDYTNQQDDYGVELIAHLAATQKNTNVFVLLKSWSRVKESLRAINQL